MTTKGPGGIVIDADRRTALLATPDTRLTTGFTGRKWVRWTQRMKSDFLDHLASTCCIRDSAAAIGVDPVSVYGLRRRDADFAAGWGEALAAGYELLETLMVGHVLAGRREPALMEGRYEPAFVDGRLGPIDVDQALRLLTHHRGAMQGKPWRGGPKVTRATRAEVDSAILKKLAAIERRKGLA